MKTPDERASEGVRVLATLGGVGYLTECQLEKLAQAVNGELARRRTAERKSALVAAIGECLVRDFFDRTRSERVRLRYRSPRGRRLHTVAGLRTNDDGKVVLDSVCGQQATMEPADAMVMLQKYRRVDQPGFFTIDEVTCGSCVPR